MHFENNSEEGRAWRIKAERKPAAGLFSSLETLTISISNNATVREYFKVVGVDGWLAVEQQPHPGLFEANSKAPTAFSSLWIQPRRCSQEIRNNEDFATLPNTCTLLYTNPHCISYSAFLEDEGTPC